MGIIWLLPRSRPPITGGVPLFELEDESVESLEPVALLEPDAPDELPESVAALEPEAPDAPADPSDSPDLAPFEASDPLAFEPSPSETAAPEAAPSEADPETESPVSN